MAKHPWLFERKEKDGTRRFYLRARVPHDIVETVGKKEFKKSLRTSDCRTAQQRINAEAAEVQAQFDAARRKLSGYREATLTDAQMAQMVRAWFAREETVKTREGAATSISSPDDLEQALAVLSEEEAHFSSAQYDEWAVTAQEFANQILDDHSVAMDKASPNYHSLCDLVRRAALEGVRRQRARLEGSDYAATFDRMFDGVGDDPEVSLPVQPVSISLHELIERFVADPARSHLRDKTLQDYAMVFRV